MKPLHYLDAEVDGAPIAWARTKTGKAGRRYNPARYQAWKDRAVVRLASAAQLRRIAGEVAVVVDVYPDRVAVKVAELDDDDPRRKGTGLRGDVDNYAKAVLDALEAAAVLANDRQVADLHVRIRPERREVPE